MSRVVAQKMGLCMEIKLETLLGPGGLEATKHVLWMDYTSVLSWFHCEALTCACIMAVPVHLPPQHSIVGAGNTANTRHEIDAANAADYHLRERTEYSGGHHSLVC